MTSSRKMPVSRRSIERKRSIQRQTSTPAVAAVRRRLGSLAVKLRSPGYRQAAVRANLFQGIAHQIRVNRERRGLTQSAFARKLGSPQTVVSRLEDPAYGRFTITTLTKVAAAFDTGLLVKFVSFPKLFSECADKTPDGLYSPTYAESMSALAFVDKPYEALLTANVPLSLTLQDPSAYAIWSWTVEPGVVRTVGTPAEQEPESIDTYAQLPVNALAPRILANLPVARPDQGQRK